MYLQTALCYFEEYFSMKLTHDKLPVSQLEIKKLQKTKKTTDTASV